MFVLVVNESTKSALVRARRVITKYLLQVGSNTWAGSISSEGLEDMRVALKATASKNTAVNCLLLEGRGRLTPCWTVGSKQLFDESGRYAFRQTAVRGGTASLRTPRGPQERLFGALLRLAGLAHDTGKASVAFARKLRVGDGSEQIRHDLVSFLVLAESLLPTKDETLSDEEWLIRVHNDPTRLVRSIHTDERGVKRLFSVDNEFAQRVTKSLGELMECARDNQDESADDDGQAVGKKQTFSTLANSSEITKWLSNAPLLGSLLWLVLTHHRQVASDDTAQGWWCEEHLNATQNAASVDDCMRAADALAPWDDEGWRSAVQSAARAAVEALRELKLQESVVVPAAPSLLALLNSHYLRPALILADHLASVRAPHGPLKSDAARVEHVYANTSGELNYGDTLADHEVAVGRLTRSVTRLYETKWPTTKLPKTSLAVVRSLKAPFDWQMELEDACIKARETGPVFTAIIAETGAGKTLAGLRAANALCGGDLRVTLALGLRTLTQQSAESMLRDAQLDPNALVVAIGQPQTLGLKEEAAKAQAARLGSESSQIVEDEYSLFANGEPCLDWLDGFCSAQEAPRLWKPKALKMLSAPVLACTTDHLVPAATLVKGGDSKLHLRLASSDLLLDEIDCYLSQDLQSLGKLALSCGIHGRNVTVMSATMSPSIRDGLYRAWLRGLEVRAHLKGTSMAHACVYSSNNAGSQVITSEGQPVSRASWEEFVAKVSRKYFEAAQAAPRRLISVANIDVNEDCKDETFERMVGLATQLHQAHHTVDPLTGRRVSVGFVRLNTTKNSWRFANYLSERPRADGAPDVRFVSYHAKYPRTYLGALNFALSQLATRKNEHAHLDSPDLRCAIQETTSEDLVVIVCTTTLIETGQDLDFDWAILEPRSVRGEIQAAGRVVRHRRDKVVTEPNIALLCSPLRGVQAWKNNDSRTQKGLWSSPGIEDELKGLIVTTPLHFCVRELLRGSALESVALSGSATSSSSASRRRGQPAQPQAEFALPVSQWQTEGLHAGACLQLPSSYESNRIGFLEHAMQEHHLLGKRAWQRGHDEAPSLHLYLWSLASMNQTHARETPFRGQRKHQVAFIPDGDVIRYWNTANPAKQSLERATHAARVTVKDARALLRNIEADARRMMVPLDVMGPSDEHINGCHLDCEQGTAAQMVLQWSPLLGFLTDEE